MKLTKTSVIAIALSLAAMANSATAATVAEGWTRPNESSGFMSSTGDALFASGTQYVDSGTNAAGIDKADIEWVWGRDADPLTNDLYDIDEVSFTFTFDLSLYDISTAVLSGQWAVDNWGEVSLNGNVISSLSGTDVSNMNQWHSYGASDESLFLAGMNSLVFTSRDEDFDALIDTNLAAKSAGGLVATAFVTADALPTAVAAVPLPAGMVLGLSGLALLGGFGRRRKS